ncbi:MAG: T9SS type A sorting domain-containing protein [Prevotella sp.]|nr:T9SS type A sorting domain-containing protein [Prevotella sp.]
MNKRTKMISALLCLMSLLGIRQATAQTLVLWHADGTQTDVQLYTQPQVKFQNDKVLITSTVLNMEYPKENILRFTYKGGSTNISSPTDEANYSQRGDQLVFRGIKSDDNVAVYTVSGIRVPVTITHDGDTATLPLSAIPSGVYLLNVNGKTSKFTKP